MNDTDYVALVDTDRAELKARIAAARERFDRLLRSADPQARIRGGEWTVAQLGAHMVNITQRYQQIIRGEDFHRATSVSDMDVINQAEMETAVAPIPEMADQILAGADEMDDWFDAHSDEPEVVAFHGGAMISGLTTQTNWLGELVMHGSDVARAVKAPFAMDDHDMLLVARGMMEYGHGFLRSDVSPATNVCVALKIRARGPT